jgi:hypothetical protein
MSAHHVVWRDRGTEGGREGERERGRLVHYSAELGCLGAAGKRYGPGVCH